MALQASMVSSGSPSTRSSPSRFTTVTENSCSSRRMFSSKEPKIFTACSSRSMLIRCSKVSLLYLPGISRPILLWGLCRWARPGRSPPHTPPSVSPAVRPLPARSAQGRADGAVGVHQSVEVVREDRLTSALRLGGGDLGGDRLVKRKVSFTKVTGSGSPNRDHWVLSVILS